MTDPDQSRARPDVADQLARQREIADAIIAKCAKVLDLDIEMRHAVNDLRKEVARLYDPGEPLLREFGARESSGG